MNCLIGPGDRLCHVLSTGARIARVVAAMVVWVSLFGPQPVMAKPSIQRVDQVLENTAGLLWTFTDHYFHYGNYGQAIRIDHLLMDLDPHFDEPYSVGAWLEWSSGSAPAAVADLQRGVQQNPDRYELYAEMGDCYWYWLKQPEKAIPYYIRATSYYSEATRVTFSALAHAAEKVGDYSRAAVAWRTARLKVGNDPVEVVPIENNLRRVMKKLRAAEGVSTPNR